MRNCVVYYFVAIIGSLIPIICASNVAWSNSAYIASPIEDRTNITYIHDESGHIHAVPLLPGHFAEEELEIQSFSVEEDVYFQLFTPDNYQDPKVFVMANASEFWRSHFRRKRPTRFVIHGWYSEGKLAPRFADTYFRKSKHNINLIAVNWQKGSDTVNYVTARNRVKLVAEHVAKFIDLMAEKKWINVEDLTIIGHSLGAHISGITGKKVTTGKVGKIVGLDPAMPLFQYKDVDGRLADTDATYVEVMHTCAGTLGFSKPLGSASFYPNGGRSQPGCGWDMTGACAHSRAYEFYLESVIEPQFFAFQCESYKNMQNDNCSKVSEIVQMGGEPGNKMAKGIFFLETNDQSMYARGFEGIVKAILAKEKKIANVIVNKLQNIKWTDFDKVVTPIKKLINTGLEARNHVRRLYQGNSAFNAIKHPFKRLLAKIPLDEVTASPEDSDEEQMPGAFQLSKSPKST